MFQGLYAVPFERDTCRDYRLVAFGKATDGEGYVPGWIGERYRGALSRRVQGTGMNGASDKKAGCLSEGRTDRQVANGSRRC